MNLDVKPALVQALDLLGSQIDRSRDAAASGLARPSDRE